MYKPVRRGGVIIRHGAYRNTNDESTAVGSELEQNTATQTCSIIMVLESCRCRQEGSGVQPLSRNCRGCNNCNCSALSGRSTYIVPDDNQDACDHALCDSKKCGTG
eukprot:scaffold13937_cov94-Skeletonema_dohrnii-CCMP3373.AAC.1